MHNYQDRFMKICHITHAQRTFHFKLTRMVVHRVSLRPFVEDDRNSLYLGACMTAEQDILSNCHLTGNPNEQNFSKKKKNLFCMLSGILTKLDYFHQLKQNPRIGSYRAIATGQSRAIAVKEDIQGMNVY